MLWGETVAVGVVTTQRFSSSFMPGLRSGDVLVLTSSATAAEGGSRLDVTAATCTVEFTGRCGCPCNGGP